MATKPPDTEFDAWNPGIVSGIPASLLPSASLFRSENISNSLAEIQELSSFSGISIYDLAAFRPKRLITHEILIRVTAELTVPDGPKYEDLGINMREMVRVIQEDYVAPELEELEADFLKLQSEAEDFLNRCLKELREAERPTIKSAPEKEGFFSRFFSAKSKKPPAPQQRDTDPVSQTLQNWATRSKETENEFHTACLECLGSVVGSITGTRGSLMADDKLVVKLATIKLMNSYGGRRLGETIRPAFQRACAEKGYRSLPVQSEPCIMNVKGASAAGKSSMRSLQKALAERIGIAWEDFAVISPDYWRKFLLDYDSIGEDYKYAAVLTGHELAIIDHKLDDYMARKAEDGRMTHLLIDRFRFDSFSADGEARSRLLTRFGKDVFLFFIITPPEQTIERAWLRGLQTGRYKAVDDLLYHNVEAFTGMPELFFSWAFSKVKRIHFEFLDNDVPYGERPKTIASGWNRELTVFDIGGMLNIERFKKINIDATNPGELYPSGNLPDDHNLAFLQQCVERLDRVEFVHPHSHEICAVAEKGKWVRFDLPAELTELRVLSELKLRRGGVASGEAPRPDVGQVPILDDELEDRLAYNLGRLPASN